MELVKFDTQKLQNPEISGVEYQQGELFGYEVREYLLEKWGRKCVYCGQENVPLEVEHIVPIASGGSNRISNLTLACHECNQKKSDKPIEEFLSEKQELLKKILRQSKAPLKDAAAVNSTRWRLYNQLKTFNLPLQTATGGRTKWNRISRNIPKEHWLDALCVGEIFKVTGIEKPVLYINCTGRGRYQRTLVDKYGFPKSYLLKSKRVYGFGTGDIVFVNVLKGKKQGQYFGRVIINARGYFDLKTKGSKICGISHKYFQLVKHNNGYEYQFQK